MRVLVTGGGTGGHIYPALALIRHLKKHHDELECLYIGTGTGLESTLVPREGIPFETVEISGFKRKISFENVQTVMKFIRGVKKSKQLIRSFNPDVVIGTGGYVSGPVVYAAAKLKIPTVVHEQNSVPGLTNKFLAKFVSSVAVTFPGSADYFPKDKTVLTGNPRATEMVETKKLNENSKLTELGLDPERKTVLIVGGSRGAKPINDAVIGAAQSLKDKSYQCLYVTGDVHFDHVQTELAQHGRTERITAVPYLHDMPAVLREVDFLVARAGATTLSEITALGLPSLLVPSPHVTNNHQEKNARYLEENEASAVLLEQEITADRFTEELDRIILDDEKLKRMKEGAASIGQPNAAYEIENLITKLVK
ncbi:undecaprenyldiphospho-muramoylpentapeptide beta-N-acetylglucosaminyltransferase [Salisediminibacterium halotolerans]|uniref:UDP-N-acetylglucosamine--N-acetylmuramyl-(pentapeptide) pyrophosphoryl-undecaprenol N-acetylglucosamine transferase n=1 Tax=Salisediminibacterium halotolerans TaxID=517425 RepID=A0A1H9PW70_9BACI|nr:MULTISPECIES: undecaprenyldiphospho-muramoylpentapeptide beta-N-acetylglucosaminyltransferase [Salisediminibacterium]RLJ74306.1 UDP-N-acetylglucosamine-N-acetylmuramylpentapeptide N-acetylglucosamine transferase [Actinophytocola xinjiangensis]RPE87601.1 UDP-N-acetylglucosamine-N-acetylmuramylpentapeptide N-acetylglucosamine transferase [Salisediminibacterium halotolerans]TWG35143.1 UDP-N-acetylglucosamine-N-acetylmuramylpentapeptide N-acetylglucosamine transferase [Salisediminibacterium halot